MIVLNITNFNGEIYQFAIPGPGRIGGIMSAFQTEIALGTRQTITEPYRNAATRQSVPQGAFEAAGQMIFSLFPKGVQRYIEKNPEAPILIQTNDVSVPWELFHDGEGFQGLSRPIGRMLMTPIDIGWKSRPAERNPRPSVLVVANPGRDDPNTDLPEADKEGSALCEFLESRGCRVNMLAGRSASRFNVMSHLQGGQGVYDIIHFAGHAVLEKGGGKSFASLELSDGRLSSHEISIMFRGSPIVFLNACHTIQSGGTRPEDMPHAYATGSDASRDLAQVFIIGNEDGRARALIGTLFRNSDSLSKDMALNFYRALLDGQCIGEALRVARNGIYSPDDVTWASYVLYGDPCLKLIESASGGEAGVEEVEEDEDASEDETTTAGSAGTDTGEGPGISGPDGVQGQAAEEDALTIDMLGGSARKALLNAMREATGTSFKMLITIHLFLGMATVKDGFTRSFLQLQVEDPDKLLDYLRKFSIALTKLLDSNGLTARVNRLLKLAREYSKLDPGKAGGVEEKHLLQAFFEDGGGTTAMLLGRLGIRLPKQDREYIVNMPLFSAEYQPAMNISARQTERKAGGEDILNALGTSGRKALDRAVDEARSMGHPGLTTPCLLIGVLETDRDGIGRTVQAAGVETARLKRYLRSVVKPGPPLLSQDIAITGRSLQILESAKKFSSGKIEANHIGMAILENGIEDPGSITVQILKHLGLNPAEMLDALRSSAFSASSADSKDTPSATPFIDEIGKDLTRMAREGRLDPVIGKAAEIDEIAEILLRKEKACPVLVGEAGVGKTAIVKAFAQKIADGRIPRALADRRVVEIAVSDLVAGTKYRGDFEKRMQGIVREVANAGDVVLFLDEIHTLVGAGGARDGAMDAGNILKPALARGDFKCIGATTHDEYRRWIESDAALERRFTPVRIAEPTPEEAVEILEGVRPSYEAHHNVTILPETIREAVKLSGANLPHKRLPDKAIDLMDRACSRVQMASDRSGKDGAYPEVTARHVREVLAALTGVPVPLCDSSEPGAGASKMADLETALNRQVVGQPNAVSALVRVASMAETRMREPGRPQNVLMFTGPVGVGKSSLAKAFAKQSGRELVQLDMTEYAERHQIAKLIGAPAGYIGHGREGFLTGKLRTHPHCVVLLDEMEKAHPDVSQLFLHLFDEGRLADAKGKTVDAQKAMFVMTSNIETDPVGSSSGKSVGFVAPVSDSSGSAPYEALGCFFSREFVDRIDRIIPFRHLGKDDIFTIAKQMLVDFSDRLHENHGVRIVALDKAVRFIVDKSFAPRSGVRPLRRALEAYVANPLSSMVAKGLTGIDRKLTIDVEAGEIVFKEG